MLVKFGFRQTFIKIDSKDYDVEKRKVQEKYNNMLTNMGAVFRLEVQSVKIL